MIPKMLITWVELISVVKILYAVSSMNLKLATQSDLEIVSMWAARHHQLLIIWKKLIFLLLTMMTHQGLVRMCVKDVLECKHQLQSTLHVQKHLANCALKLVKTFLVRNVPVYLANLRF
jgi:hypothetical protein